MKVGPVLVCICGVLGCRAETVVTTSYTQGIEPTSATVARQPKSDDKPIEVTAEALAKEFKKDREGADQKYTGKTIHVTGVSGGQIEDLVLYLKTSTSGDVVAVATFTIRPRATRKRSRASLRTRM